MSERYAGARRHCAYDHSSRHQELSDHAALHIVVDLPSHPDHSVR